MQRKDLSLEEIRKLFPILKERVNGCKLSYLDSAATAQMPQSVIDSISNYYSKYKSNIGRGVYQFAEHSTEQFEIARENIAQFINAKEREVITTSGTTNSINLVAQGWACSNIKKGDEILISETEHHSNFVPWQQFAIKRGAILKFIPVGKRGVIEFNDLKKMLSKKTKLVSVVHSSNILGSTNDVKEITRLAHEAGAHVLIDAAQSIAHHKIDVKDIGCDFLSFSGHKLFGPTGIGILYFKEEMFHESSLVNYGGGMVYSVSKEESFFKEMPYCFEAGTQPIAQMIGLGKAIEFINKYIDFDRFQKHETFLTKKLIDGLSEIKNVQVVSYIPQKNEHGHLVTFVSDKYHAHDIASHLDRYGIAVRAGNHCAQSFHQRCSLTASVRASFSIYNTEEEVDKVLSVLKEFLD